MEVKMKTPIEAFDFVDIERRQPNKISLTSLFVGVLILGVLSTVLTMGVTAYCSTLN